MQQIDPAVAAEEPAQHLEPVRRQPFPAGQELGMLGQMPGDPFGQVLVCRVPGEILRIAGRGAGERRPVDPVRMPMQRGESGGDQDLAQALWMLRKIAQGAESAEALAQDAPGRAAERGPDGFGVGDDRVGSELAEVRSLCRGVAAGRQGLPVRRAGKAGSALVQQQHPEFFERFFEPAGGRRRPVCPESGPALEVDQPRCIRPCEVADFPGED